MAKQPPKPDCRLALGYGSAWHLLQCLGWQRNRFNALLAAELEATDITWEDSPPHEGGKSYPSGVPIRDGELKRIEFIDDEELQSAYDSFWPNRGEQQNWDAVGRATIRGESEWVLVEAKGRVGEIKSDGTTAKENGGRPKIRAAFTETLQALGYDNADAARRADTWLKGHYQHANRVATLNFLLRQNVPARLVFLYFCGDQHPGGKRCPATPADWQPTLNEINESLGLTGRSKLENRIHTVFLDVNLGVN